MEIAQKASGVTFVSNDSRELWTVRLLWAAVVLGGIIILSHLLELELLSRIINGGTVTEEEASLNDVRQGLLAWASILLFLATVIIYCYWLHRAYSNLMTFRLEGTEFTPSKAVGSYFIPFINLYRPLKVTQELWKGSDLDIDASDDVAWKSKGDNNAISRWWGAWILLNLSGQFVFRYANSAEELDELRNSTLLSIGSEILGIVAAVLALKVVQMISRRQNAKAAKMGLIQVSSTQFE